MPYPKQVEHRVNNPEIQCRSAGRFLAFWLSVSRLSSQGEAPVSKVERRPANVDVGQIQRQREAIRMHAEMHRQDYEAQTAEAQSRIQYQIDYSKNLLNGLMVVNGGAIIAILTFIGNTGSKVDPARMESAFRFYSGGLALVFVAYMGAFFSQFFFYNAAQYMAWNAQLQSIGDPDAPGDPGKYDVASEGLKGNVSIGLGVVACLLSLGAFVAGSVAALNALT